MTADELQGSFWPTPKQGRLLRVLFADVGESGEEWRRMRSEFELEHLEPGSYDLMPLLYKRLAQVAPDDPVVEKLRGIYRRTWYANHLEVRATAPALAALVGGEIDPLVVNGWELVTRYYGDAGVRPVSGLHVVVRPQLAAAAEGLLVAEGWRAQRHPALPRREFSVRLTRGETECVIHRQLFHEFVVPPDESAALDLWSGAVDISVGDVRARALAPADEFLNVCLSGARARAWPNARWAADAATIVSTSSDFDWERVLEHAQALRATLRLRDALSYLEYAANLHAPAQVRATLASAGDTRRERLAHAMSGWRGRRGQEAPESVSRYLRVSADKRPLPAAAGFPAFLRDEWGLRRTVYVPPVATMKMLSRLAARRGVGAATPAQR